jgi:prevent-host-death family protein
MYKPYEPHSGSSVRVSVSDARETFAELVNRAAYKGERVRVARRGRAIAAIISIEDLELLERLESDPGDSTSQVEPADAASAAPTAMDRVPRTELGL